MTTTNRSTTASESVLINMTKEFECCSSSRDFGQRPNVLIVCVTFAPV